MRLAGASATTHDAHGLPVPIEIRFHVRAALATGPADRPRLNIGQSNIIGPAHSADGNRMAAAMVGAVHQNAAHAHVAILGRLIR
jgi:hypothetical protein